MPPPPPDASTDAGTEPATEPATESSVAESVPESSATDRADIQDTLDLRLPDELIALFGANDTAVAQGAYAGRIGVDARTADPAHTPARRAASSADDLLDNVADWGPATTTAGVFQLVPVRTERDLPLVSRWMNDPAVAAFWELAGPEAVTEAHLRAQIDGDGRSVPCLGVLDGTPMSYWEVYRADLDALARHYPARPHDTGLHLLIGGVADRGRGLGTSLLRAVADLVLDHRASCARVIAEPDLRNTPSVSAFLSAGFRFAAEVDLPDKRAALMVRDRALRAVL
ncbi:MULTISPECIES: GNAT family N-acetyltransferase [unclassified Streptomyces]|uniref:GNAT family N-acetyltransferase n=1 Tax=unclassified Streptomyces TaxID=2593676 RepID=UPI0033E0590A